MSAHGSVPMAVEPGGSKNSCSGEPGADVRPRVRAARRSSNPKLFQRRTSQRTPAPRVDSAQATGTAVAPAMISPHPALGANGAEMRPVANSNRNRKPTMRMAWTLISAGSGRDALSNL